MIQYREIETLFRKLTELILFSIIDRHYEQISLDMKSRFISNLNKRPELLNLVSQKDLASYLNIDPTNLSKLINSVKI
jgi:DNA-binding MarR family transcriptional regulator